MNCGVEKRLSAPTKLAYGLGELGPAMAGSVLVFSQLDFMINAAGMAAGLAGMVMLVGKFWDAVNDPLIGWLSDNTKSPWGRRLPWIVAGAVPLGLLFFLMWYVPSFLAGGGQVGLFIYFVIVGLLFNSAYTAVALPHSALTPEFSSDYDERSRITGFRMACSVAGSVGGLVALSVVFKWLKDSTQQVQFAALGAVVGGLILLALIICLIGIWRPALDVEKRRALLQSGESSEKIPISQQIKIVASNRPFLIVCGIYMFSWLAMQFTATILPLYVQLCLKLPKDMFPLIALVVQCTALLMIPFWSWVCVKLNKKAAYYIAIPIWLVAQAGLLFLNADHPKMIWVLAAMAGIGISVCYLVPNAMLPDTIELDELKTGKRREGVFYGFFVFLQKLVLALSVAIIGWVLDAAGYVASKGVELAEQPASAITAIRIAIGPLPAVVLMAGIVLVFIFPINKSKHAENLAELAARRAAGEPRVS